MTKSVELTAKTFSYLIGDGSESKKAKDTKKYVMKRKLGFKNYKNCLQANQLESKKNYLEKKKLPWIVSFVTKKNIKNSLKKTPVNQY